MNRIVLGGIAAVLSLGVALPAGAAINARQHNQERLIDAGVRSGKLTPREAARLRAEQRHIEATKAAMKARHGGKVTKRDEERLHAMQQAAGRHIDTLKANHHHAKPKKIL